ncbi:hypothetical protein MMC07_005656 [Pseudocyphellaria aurata]|nr:hypothetical protein [Pseudocyphellaria aurata]
MDQEFSTVAFGTDEYYPPQATVSLAETTLVTPNSPESFYSVKDEEEDKEDKKPTKKRKSWGQELPTPKTNLPPRKRAKTEDEKEQRRIERVLRNRQAAQSSRERKRQEVEKLEGEKSAIELQNQRLKERLLAVEHEKFQLAQKVARMAAEMSVFKCKYQPTGSIAASPAPSRASPSIGAELHQLAIKQELDDYPLSLPTPQNSVDQSTSSFSSPTSSTYSRSPSPSQVDEGLGADATSLDLTQHPAAMLCGLQCQSEEPWPALIPLTTRDKTRRLQQMIGTQLLYLTLISVVYSRVLHPLHLIFTSLRTGSPLPSKITPKTTPMLFLLIRWLISTPANLTTMPCTTTTGTKVPTSHPTTSHPSPVRQPTFRIRLLRRLLLCSPALARPLKGATGRAMRPKTNHALTRESAGSSERDDRSVIEDGGVNGLADDDAVIGMTMAMIIGSIEKENRRYRHLARRQKRICTSRRQKTRG